MRWWQIRKRDADLERELRSDLELEEEEQRANGLSAEQAHRAARRSFGNTTLIREQVHEAWGWASIERLLDDARYGFRRLWQSPGFSIVAVMTLALGIGATTAIFTLVYDVMLRPLPFPQPDRLVTLEEKVAEWSNIYPTLPVSANHFMIWQQSSHSFDSMAIMEQGTAPLGGGARPVQVMALSATPGIFSVLRVQPAQGRGFTAEEAQRGHDHVAVLTYDLWREHFNGDPGILGKTITLDGFSYSVIGVMPQSFHMPSIQARDTIGSNSSQAAVGILIPLSFSQARLAEEMGDLNYFGLARLKEGTSVAAATVDLDALQHRISANLPPDEKATLSATVTPFYVPYWYRSEPTGGIVIRTHQDPSEMAAMLRESIWSIDRGVPVPTVRALGGIVADSVANRRFEMDLLLLFAASALFLAGLGVYGVLTYSVSQRNREIGLRLALGAQRASIYWLVLRDGLLPLAIGSASGIAMAFGSERMVSGLLFQVSPYDPVLSAGAVSVLLAVGTIACLLPASRAAAVEPMQTLRTE